MYLCTNGRCISVESDIHELVISAYCSISDDGETLTAFLIMLFSFMFCCRVRDDSGGGGRERRGRADLQPSQPPSRLGRQAHPLLAVQVARSRGGIQVRDLRRFQLQGSEVRADRL